MTDPLTDRMRSAICALLDYGDHVGDCRAVETGKHLDCDCGWPDERDVAEGLLTEHDAARADTAPSCCELACYEDPGCACDGCQPARTDTAALDALAAFIDGWLIEESPEVWSRTTEQIGRDLARAIKENR